MPIPGPTAYAAEMAQGQNVIYLPPGVVPSQQAPGPPPTSQAVPFNREFFEQVLPGAIQAFCQQLECESPIVEVLTVDNVRHYVKGISGTSDAWVALHVEREDHEHPVQVFLPYQTIVRVEVHPEAHPGQRRLGFIVR